METLQRERLREELLFALERTRYSDLRNWALRVPKYGLKAVVSRINLVGSLAKSVGSEFASAFKAIKRGNERDYFHDLRVRFSTEKDEKLAGLQRGIVSLAEAARQDPKDVAIRYFTLALGFNVGSGGFDGDGGLADSDLLAGIGAHRSIFTHSILMGVAVETICLSVLDLSRVLHQNLPDDHSEKWDQFLEVESKSLSDFKDAVSIGLSYHLGIDATIDGGGTYKDLPFSAPQEVHQVILAANAVAEANSVIKKDRVFDIVFPEHSEALLALKELGSTKPYLSGNRSIGWKIYP